MKWIFWVLIFLVFVTPIIFISIGIEHLDIMKDRYKRAVDAGVDAAVKYGCYSEEYEITDTSSGYGTGLKSKYNITVNKDEMLIWFYRVFFRNLGIDANEAAQKNIKRYMPMKALITYNKLIIADINDSWSEDIYYDIKYNGKVYRFTLSDQIWDNDRSIWLSEAEVGITSEKRQQLISSFIKDNLSIFLNKRQNFESGLYYDVNISVSDIDTKTDDISGINFIVLIEGLPLPSLNPGHQEKYYAFSLGGSEVNR